MAQSKAYQRKHYPLMAYNFRVTVNGTAMAFSEVSGLEREYGTVTYRHGFSFLEGEAIRKYYYEKYVPVTFKRGTVKSVRFLYQWLADKGKSTVEVSLCDDSGIPVIGWHIAKAVPVKLQAPGFVASANDVAIETLEIMAAGISIKDHTS